MFENVDGRTDARVTGILIAHLGAFGSGELKTRSEVKVTRKLYVTLRTDSVITICLPKFLWGQKNISRTFCKDSCMI